MLSRRELISSPAHDAIEDGDDLHITDSYEGDEENSSVIANASCHTRSLVVEIFDKPKVTKKDDTVDGNINDGERGGMQFSKKSQKVMNILRQQSRRLLPLNLRHKAYLFRSSTNTVAEYEEMLENDFGLEEEENYAHDFETIASLRSSRKNVRTGESMLIRQKAQVVSRPSTAHSNWEVSKSPDPKNYRSSMLRGKSLILDDSSIGGMSDITEDTSAFYGYQNMVPSSLKRTPMFINTNTYCIDEDEDESESDCDENDRKSSPDGTVESAYDFREVIPLNDSIESTSEVSSRPKSPVASVKQVKVLAIYDHMRRRVYSDSQIDTEGHNDVVDSNSQVSNSPNSNGNSDLEEEEQLQKTDLKASSGSYYVDKLLRKRFENPQSSKLTPSNDAAAHASWPFPRTRTYSDSYIDQMSSPSDEHRSGMIADSPLRVQPFRRQSLPLFERDEQQNGEVSRPRTYSDSVVNEKSAHGDMPWNPRNSSLLDVEFDFDELAFAPRVQQPQLEVVHSNISSPSTKSTDSSGIINPPPATSSVLASLSHTNIEVAHRFVAKDNRKTLQQPLVQKPSPRTLNAASKIAAALRPNPTKQLPTLPTKSPSAAATRSDQYYWGSTDVQSYISSSSSSGSSDQDENQDMELKNLCSWSSESFEDLF
jgi:hypothetical protein